MNNKIVKILSFGLTVTGAIVSVAASILEEKKLDSKVAEKVSEQFANLGKNGES